MAQDKVVGEIIEGLSKNNIEDALNSLSQMGESIPSSKVLYLVADEKTKKYIKDLGLYNPKKLARFFIDVGFSAVEAVIDSAHEIQNDIIWDYLSKIDSIKQKIRHTIQSDNPNEKMSSYQDELIELRNVFEKRMRNNIQNVVQIDNMNPLERKIQSAFLVSKVDSYTKNAQICLKAVIEIAKLQIYVAEFIGDSKFDTIRNDIDDFMNQHVFKDNTIYLMNEWARKEDRDYWSDKIRTEYEETMEHHGELLELFDDIRKIAEEKSVDLENIIFE